MKQISLKNVFLVAVLFTFLSCSDKTTKNISTENVSDFVKGTVTSEFKDDGCDFLIKATVKGSEMIYAAINLDESLKKEGKQFQFKFRPTRAPRKGACKKGIYIYIEEFK